MVPGNETIDAAKSHMAYHDAQARLKPEIMSDMGNCETKTYSDHFVPAGKTRDIDNLSTVAQQSTNASMDVDEGSEKVSKYHDGKVNPPNQKGRERLNPGTSAQPWRPKAAVGNNEGIVPSQAFQAPSANYQAGCNEASNVSNSTMEINDLKVKHKSADLRNKVWNSVPQQAHSLQTKQLQPEITLNLEPNMSVSENRKKNPGSFNDTSEDLIDFGDSITTLQQPTAVVIDETSQTQNLGSQAVQYDLLSGDLDELRAGMIGELENPIIPKTCFYDKSPRVTPDDTVETVTKKVLAALAPTLSHQTQLRGTIDQPDCRAYEQFAIKKEKIPEPLEAINLPMMERFSVKNKSNGSQDKIIPQSRASDASMKTSSSSSTNRRSQQNVESNSVKILKQGKELLLDGSSPNCSPPSNFRKLPTNYPTSQISNSLSDARCSEAGTNQSSKSTFSKHSFIKNGGLKKVFRRSNLAEDDIDRMIPEGTFLTAFFIKSQSYQQIPTDRVSNYANQRSSACCRKLCSRIGGRNFAFLSRPRPLV